ncbi:MAG: opacity protein-like surface antigen [Bacteroidia bacterium]|jgi:opacity protein-like surface antigen
MGNNMKKLYSLILLVALITLVATPSEAQTWKKESSLEFGIMFGGSNYQGDLTNKFFEQKGTHANGGLIVRYNPVQRFTFRLGVNYGSISGDDAWYPEDELREFRNLHFKSEIWDFHAGFDINLNTFDLNQERGIIPYVTIGVGVFKFNPQAQFFYDANSWHSTGLQNYSSLASRDGDWVELQPLGTEGQETTEYNDIKRYALTQLSIPFGVGFKFKLSKQWTFGVEYVPRYTFTDYIDDVSGNYVEPVYLESQYSAISPAMSDRTSRNAEQSLAGTPRGDQSKRDMYSIFGVTLTYRIIRSGDRCPIFF